MSVMTIVAANISDIAGFAEAGNSWGKQKLMDTAGRIEKFKRKYAKVKSTASKQEETASPQ